MKYLSVIKQAEIDLVPIFSEIDAKVKQNLHRVIEAFRQQRVGVQHFASVSGYGHDDLGRDTLDQVFSQVMGAESAAVRVQLVSGTHAIACALFGILRPGDELLSVVGAPYDTLEEVIGLRGSCKGSLADFNISYRQLPLTIGGSVDWQGLKTAVRPETRLVLIQRSCGYSWRPSLAIAEIEKIITQVKAQKSMHAILSTEVFFTMLKRERPFKFTADAYYKYLWDVNPYEIDNVRTRYYANNNF